MVGRWYIIIDWYEYSFVKGRKSRKLTGAIGKGMWRQVNLFFPAESGKGVLYYAAKEVAL
jgi:hypothetical protein